MMDSMPAGAQANDVRGQIAGTIRNGTMKSGDRRTHNENMIQTLTPVPPERMNLALVGVGDLAPHGTRLAPALSFATL